MTPLARQLRRQIAQAGPITLAEYMGRCLTDPEHGYYTGRDPLGAAGDFTTAPEISQLFGEMLGLCLAQAWADQGRPAPVTLAEPGPGRGTLMADILRAGRAMPGFVEAARVVLVEASPALRARQAQTLEGRGARWADSLDALPEAPLFLVANEFFDALPIRQFVRDGAAWRERMVGLDAAGGLAFGLSVPAPLAALSGRLADTAQGDVVETCPAAGPAMAAIAGRVARHGGAAVIVDYGGWRSLGDTLQAVRGHAPADPLDAPGLADLTAHVDFEALACAARAAGAAVTGPTPQGVLLERLGITARAQALAHGLSGPALDALAGAHRRLTHPDEMGSLFKALGVVPPGAPPLPGFDP